MFAEGEALEQFASTSIGMHPLFRVMRVQHHSPKCLIETVANGDTVATVLQHVTRSNKASSPPYTHTLSLTYT